MKIYDELWHGMHFIEMQVCPCERPEEFVTPVLK